MEKLEPFQQLEAWRQRFEVFLSWVLPAPWSAKELCEKLRHRHTGNVSEFVLHWGLSRLTTEEQEADRKALFQKALATSSPKDRWNLLLQGVYEFMHHSCSYPPHITTLLKPPPEGEGWSYQDRMCMIVMLLSKTHPHLFAEEESQGTVVFYNRHIEECCKFVQALGVPPEYALDVFHDAFLKVHALWCNPDKAQETRSILDPKAYLSTAVYNSRDPKAYLSTAVYNSRNNFFARIHREQKLKSKFTQWMDCFMNGWGKTPHGSRRPQQPPPPLPAEIALQSMWDAFVADFPAEAEVLLLLTQGIAPKDLPDFVHPKGRTRELHSAQYSERYMEVFSYKARDWFRTFWKDRTWKGFQKLYPKYAKALELVADGTTPDVLPLRLGRTKAEKQAFVREAYRKCEWFCPGDGPLQR